ncbi:hypothetical protein DACRYDRAFT_91302 [Dacryopinax primogenitus]|uniref:Aspergillopepsin n=1 Tax=Dacryopinax primogenitus (strain DJM 731) TaxID=1858805 RepID=M5FWN2_DACPD|nr:uncharacterized protein DACRYDRAFT_91302 [Dacryopinax primogenitus]EJT97836.1 hypothetical protein DACRYDRAFT_91302 [Dacryopinax primogenitus]
MVAITLLTSALFATAALAAPSSRSRLEQRMARRSLGAHLSTPNQRITAATDFTGPKTEATTAYSSNWAGPVYNANAGTYKAVTGTFTVPTPSAPSGGRGSYAASAWVGIDGDSCDTAILQTGLDFTIDNGKVSYDAWYEWYPDYAYDFSGISFSAGNEVRVTVTATSTTSGTAVIENLTTGETVTQDITSSSALCEQDAEWIVEDFTEGNSLVPFANFGSVAFTSAEATTSSGSTQGPSGATYIFDIEQNNKVLTSVTTGTSTTTITYV